MTDLQILTNSRIKAARACLRLHHNRYNLGYRAVREDEAPRFGSLIHGGLEAWWRCHELPADDRLAAALGALEGAADAYERAKAEVLLTGYHLRWSDEPLHVVSVEEEFAGPLVNPETRSPSRTWRLGGKLDVLVVDTRDGLARLVEHKTSSEDVSPGSEYWRRLRMDGQVSVYYDGAAFMGHEVAGCIYDVIGKPAQRPSQVALLDEAGEKIVLDAAGARVRTKDGKRWRQTGDSEQGYTLQTRDETPDEYRARLTEVVGAAPDRFFARGEVVRLEAEMDEARFDIWQTAATIRAAQQSGAHPRNPDACIRYGRTCEFFPVCTGEANLEDTTLYQLGPTHPELAGAPPAATSEEERQQ